MRRDENENRFRSDFWESNARQFIVSIVKTHYNLGRGFQAAIFLILVHHKAYLRCDNLEISLQNTCEHKGSFYSYNQVQSVSEIASWSTNHKVYVHVKYLERTGSIN